MNKGHLETEEGREAARGLGDQGERVGCTAMENHGGCMNGGGGGCGAIQDFQQTPWLLW